DGLHPASRKGGRPSRQRRNRQGRRRQGPGQGADEEVVRPGVASRRHPIVRTSRDRYTGSSPRRLTVFVFVTILGIAMSVENRAQEAPGESPGRPVAAARRSPAWHRISAEPGYLRAELFNRRTVEETRQFLDVALAATIEHQIPQVLF